MKYVNRIAMVFAACLITLACVELVYSKMHLNVYRRDISLIGSAGPWIIYDPLMGVMNKPEYSALGKTWIDKNGFRIIESSPAPDKRNRLIVCMGDSGTFGVSKVGEGVLGIDSFPSFLQNDLSGQHYLVINAGVLGYSSSHVLRQYVVSIRKLKPQIIVVRVGHNDHRLSWDKRLDMQQPKNAVLRYLYANYPSTLTVQTIAQYIYMSGERSMGRPWSIPWSTLDQYESNLRELIRIANSDGVKVFLVDYPLRPSSIPPASKKDLMDHLSESSYEAYLAVHEKYMQQMEAVAKSTGTQIIRTRSRLEDPKEGAFSGFDAVHPSKHGMQIIAEEIAKVLLKENK